MIFDPVKAFKNCLSRMCEQIGVIEVPKISGQESVEVVKIIT